MTKLNNTIREMIVDNAIHTQFGPTAKSLEDQENDLAIACYDHFYSMDFKLITKLSRGWFDVSDWLQIRCGYEAMTLRSKKEAFLLPSNYDYRTKMQTLPIDHKLSNEIADHARSKEIFKEKKDQARKALRNMLSDILTLKHLIDTWPEGKPFYQWLLDNPAERKTGLPAVQITTINKMLGIKENEN